MMVQCFLTGIKSFFLPTAATILVLKWEEATSGDGSIESPRMVKGRRFVGFSNSDMSQDWNRSVNCSAYENIYIRTDRP
jgi:hypothetical protein